MGNLKPGSRPCHLDIHHGACFHTIKHLSLDCFQRGRRRATKGPIIWNYSSTLRWRWSRIGMDKLHWDGARWRRTRCSWHERVKQTLRLWVLITVCQNQVFLWRARYVYVIGTWMCGGGRMMWEWFITNSWTIMSWVWSLCFQRAIVLPEFI